MTLRLGPDLAREDDWSAASRGHGRGLSRHPQPGAPEDLFGLGRVGDRRREEPDREAAVLLAGGVDDPARVPAVGAAG